jgi:hypothetical protein
MTYIPTFETEKSLNREPLMGEQVPMSTLPPATPFPRKYVLSVFVTLQDARQAAQALSAAGFEERTIHVLESGAFVEAVSRGQSPLDFLGSMDYDVYLSEAHCGHSFLAVRPANSAQLKQIRAVLAPHRAHLVTYIDTWTTAKLLP